MKHKFLCGTFSPEKQDYPVSDDPLLPEIFRSNDPKRRVPLTFPTRFSGQFLYMVNNHNDIPCSANEDGTGKYVTR